MKVIITRYKRPLSTPLIEFVKRSAELDAYGIDAVRYIPYGPRTRRELGYGPKLKASRFALPPDSVHSSLE